MINVKELEKRWLKYKTKSLMLIVLIVAIIGSLIYSGYYILYKLDFGSKKAVVSKVIDDKNISDTNISIATPSPTLTPTPTAEHRKDIIQLAPTIPIVDVDSEEVKRRPKKIIRHKKRLVKSKRVKPKLVVKKKVKPRPVVKGEVKEEETEHKIKKIDLKITSNNYIEIMKKKFYRNKNPRDALLIGEAYYRAGNYKESEMWALKANNLDKNSEKSWLLFAKSKNALGKREEALKVLIAYYNRTKSPRAKRLIEKINSKGI